MRNEFRGVCHKCGQMVAPGAGFVRKVPLGRHISGSDWKTEHGECPGTLRVGQFATVDRQLPGVSK